VLETAVLKTIAAFLNSAEGGTLLIGVADDGTIHGIESDYATLPPGRHCATVVYRHFGEPRDASNSYTWCFSLH